MAANTPPTQPSPPGGVRRIVWRRGGGRGPPGRCGGAHTPLSVFVVINLRRCTKTRDLFGRSFLPPTGRSKTNFGITTFSHILASHTTVRVRVDQKALMHVQQGNREELPWEGLMPPMKCVFWWSKTHFIRTTFSHILWPHTPRSVLCVSKCNNPNAEGKKRGFFVSSMGCGVFFGNRKQTEKAIFMWIYCVTQALIHVQWGNREELLWKGWMPPMGCVFWWSKTNCIMSTFVTQTGGVSNGTPEISKVCWTLVIGRHL